MHDAVDDFRSAILAAIGFAPDSIEPDHLHRFPTSGKRSDLSGWCKLFADGRAGVFGCFRAGASEVWSAGHGPVTPAERAAMRSQVVAAKAQREREQRAAWRRNADRIAHLWRQCRPVTAGDPVHRYLRGRLAVESPTVPECLRLHRAMPYTHDGEQVGTWPAMTAPIVGADGAVLALHRTYLTSDGRKASVPGPVKKLTPAAGLLTGASIRLHDPRAGLLGVAEGIETALAASLGSGVPTVAAYSAGALAGFLWPRGVRRLVIFADNDDAGRRAAEDLRARAARAGLSATVLTPTIEGGDWCDVLARRHAIPLEPAA